MSCTFMLTFKHFIDVIPEVLHPPFITKISARYLLRDAVFCHIYHRVSILHLKKGNEAICTHTVSDILNLSHL